MRLFVALEIPIELRDQIGAFVEERRPALPEARWVPARNLHLTLAFLGETPPMRVAELDRCLAPLFAARRPMSLRLRRCGSFPPRGRARVVWIGFESDRDLEKLGEAVKGALATEFGLARERRRFHPHLTVARCSRPWPPTAVESWRASGSAGWRAPFVVDRGVLMESRLGSGAARYSVVGDYPLRGVA